MTDYTIKRPKLESSKTIPARRDTSDSIQARHPSLSLRHVHSKFCVTGCDSRTQKSFLKKFKAITAMTWAQVQSASREGLGYERIAQLDDELPEAAGGEKSMCFRLHGIGRMIGFRKDDVFYVVWFDEKGKKYKH